MTPPFPASPDPRIAEEIARYQRCEDDAGGAYSYECTDEKLCDRCFCLAGEIKRALTAASEQARQEAERELQRKRDIIEAGQAANVDQARRLDELGRMKQAAEQRASEAEQQRDYYRHLYEVLMQTRMTGPEQQLAEAAQRVTALEAEKVAASGSQGEGVRPDGALEPLPDAAAMHEPLNSQGWHRLRAEDLAEDRLLRLHRLEAQQAAQDATITRLREALEKIAALDFGANENGWTVASATAEIAKVARAALAAAPRPTPEGQDA